MRGDVAAVRDVADDGRGEILIQADGDGAEIVELLLTSAAERARL